jgi:hypothetical protein
MPVTNPTAGDVHVNAPLTNFGQKYLLSANSFIASRAMPNIPVSKQSDLYYEFNQGDFLRDEAVERADGTESAGGGFRLSTSPYFANVYAFHKDVTDRQRANQDVQVRLDQSAAQWVTQKLLIKRELSFTGAYVSAGKWATDKTLAAADRWDQSTSDPISQVREGKRVVQGQTGMRPNKMIIARDAYDTLLDNDAIVGRIAGGATVAMPALVQKQRLTELLELDEIYILDGIYNSSAANMADPTAATIGFMSSGKALLYYAPASVNLDEPTAGTQFSWSGFTGATNSGQRIKRFRMEHLSSDRIEGEMAFDYKLVGESLGYFFPAVLTD